MVLMTAEEDDDVLPWLVDAPRPSTSPLDSSARALPLDHNVARAQTAVSTARQPVLIDAPRAHTPLPIPGPWPHMMPLRPMAPPHGSPRGRTLKSPRQRVSLDPKLRLPMPLEIGGERWAMGAMLSRERQATVHAVHMVKSARDSARLRESENAAQRKSAATFSELLTRFAAAEEEVLKLSTEKAQLESMVIELKAELVASAKAKIGMTWRLDSSMVRQQQLTEAVDQQLHQIEEQAEELQEAKHDHDREMQATITTMTTFNKAERDKRQQLQQRKQSMEAQHFSACLLQKHARRKVVQAQSDVRRANERLNDVMSLADTQMKAAKEAVLVDRATAKFLGTQMTMRSLDGTVRLLTDGIKRLVNGELARFERAKAQRPIMNGPGAKYNRELVLGKPEEAALGIVSILNIDLFELFAICNRGLDSIREEWNKHGSDDDKECVRCRRGGGPNVPKSAWPQP